MRLLRRIALNRGFYFTIRGATDLVDTIDLNVSGQSAAFSQLRRVGHFFGLFERLRGLTLVIRADWSFSMEQYPRWLSGQVRRNRRRLLHFVFLLR